jgi:S-adenosylmethionine uptake transporter
MFYLLLCASILSIPPAFIQWNQATIFGFDLPLSPKIINIFEINFKLEHFLLLGVIAACYFVHAVAYFNALKSELSVVISFRYTKLIFSGLLGYLIFNEQHQNASYIGYVLIILAGLLLVRAQIRKMALDKKSKAKEESECAI